MSLDPSGSELGRYRVQIYFLDKIDSISSISLSDFQDTMAYREQLKQQGVLFKTFGDKSELSREIRVNIQRSINYP
jgi:hypothetical protein